MVRRVLFPFVFVVACGDTNNPPVDRCDGVRCTGTEICDPATGACRPRSPADGGAGDAGRADGGVDAGGPRDGGGQLDAGLDAGPMVDAGVDAGAFDAGPPGCQGDQDCFGVRGRCVLATGACVECLIDSHCPSAIPRCDVIRNVCVECLSNVDCQNPQPVCRGTVCDDCLTLAECGAGRTCELLFGDCVELPDSCAAPQALNVPAAGGSTFVTVDPSQAIDDLTASCGAGPDLVYALTLSGPRDVNITAQRVGAGTAQPSVSLRAAPCTTGAELACDAALDAGAVAALSLSGVAAGSYLVVLETPSGSSGRVQLGVTAVAPNTPASNDGCAAPEALSFFGTRAVAVGSTFLGTNSSAGANDPTCSPTAASTGKDLVYSYDIDAGTNVSISVRPVNGSTLVPVVSVRPLCVSATSEAACSAATVAGETRTINLTNQPAGRSYIWVDSANGSAGSFQLEVTRTPVVANDTCAGIQPLSFTGVTAAATGDTSFATNDNAVTDASPTCSATARSSGQDVVFSYTLAQSRDVTVSVTPTGASPTFWPVVSIRNGCANGAGNAEVACVAPNNAVQARATLVNQPPGTYVVWVDSAAQTAGPFQLEVVTAAPTPPPSNDSCSAPQALVFTNNVATVTSSTLQAANDNFPFDVSPTCSTTAKQNGRDVVYSFTLTSAQDVTLEVTPSTGSLLRPVLYVRRNNCNAQVLSDELVCLERVGVARTVLTNLAPGTYFLFVDGAGGSSGAFTLSVTRGAPTPFPANDDCSGAQALTFTNDVATVTGTTFGASNSNSPVDNAPACGVDFVARRWGRDLVYWYALTAARDVELRVTSAAGSPYTPLVYVRPAAQCTFGFSGAELACGASSGRGTASVYLPNQPAGAYSVFVDSDSYDTGSFTLTATQRAATLPPANDRCSAPTVVPLGATGVTGNTTGATNDYSISSSPRYAPVCGNRFFDGRDVVFSFTAPTSGSFTATVTPQGSFDPSLLMLQGSCSAAQCVRSAETAGPGASEAVTFTAAAGQQVFFVVDSVDAAFSTAFGAFTLRVQ